MWALIPVVFSDNKYSFLLTNVYCIDQMTNKIHLDKFTRYANLSEISSKWILFSEPK